MEKEKPNYKKKLNTKRDCICVPILFVKDDNNCFISITMNWCYFNFIAPIFQTFDAVKLRFQTLLKVTDKLIPSQIALPVGSNKFQIRFEAS